MGESRRSMRRAPLTDASGVHLAVVQYRIVALLEQSVVGDRESGLHAATLTETRCTIVADDARTAITVCATACSGLAPQFELLAPTMPNPCTEIPSPGGSVVLAQALMVCPTGRKD